MFPSSKVSIASTTRLAAPLVLLLALLVPPPAWALPADGDKFKDWTARCETDPADPSKRQCVVTQTVFENESQQNVMSFVVAFPPQQKQGRIVVVLPLGSDLRAGIDLKVDDSAPSHLDFGVCLRDGCQAALTLDDAMLSSFKRGSKAEITFRYLPRQKTIKVPLSLDGFTAAAKSLQ